MFTTEADRHGSIVWEAGEAYEGQRYVTVALSAIDADELLLGSGYLVETWAGASDEKSYTRKVTYRASVPSPAAYPDLFAHTLKPAIRDTLHIARTLNPQDPDELDLPSAISLGSAATLGFRNLLRERFRASVSSLVSQDQEIETALSRVESDRPSDPAFLYVYYTALANYYLSKGEHREQKPTTS